MRAAVFQEPGTPLTVENVDDPSPAAGQVVINAPGVEIISKPKLTEYPGYGGKGKIRVLVSKFYDADGYILEVNQILSD